MTQDLTKLRELNAAVIKATADRDEFLTLLICKHRSPTPAQADRVLDDALVKETIDAIDAGGVDGFPETAVIPMEAVVEAFGREFRRQWRSGGCESMGDAMSVAARNLGIELTDELKSEASAILAQLQPRQFEQQPELDPYDVDQAA